MFVYKITNIVDGKFYIGKTQKTLEERFKRHLIRKSSPKLMAAISKYGKENFKIELIDKATSKEELNTKEKYWIEKLMAIENGYNLTYGGDGGIPTAETIEKIRVKARNRRFSAKTKDLWSKQRIGRNNPKSKKVLVVDENCIELCFYTIKDASKYLGISHSTGMALAKGIKASKKQISIEIVE